MTNVKGSAFDLGALLAMAWGGLGLPEAGFVPQSHLRRRNGRFGPYVPHQGPRERARRIGGQVWTDFKNFDRASRGLPPK